MSPSFVAGDAVSFLGQRSIIQHTGQCADGSPKYLCAVGSLGLLMWVRHEDLDHPGRPAASQPVFHRRRPHLLVVDSFLAEPDRIRAMALEQEFVSDVRYYKGRRTPSRHLWPLLKEEFERLLGGRITDWLTQPANGVFQVTGFDDPLVWHSDTQDYAAAIYLTPDAPLSAGTSFWRDRRHGCRREIEHPLERARFRDPVALNAAARDVWTDFNVLNPDNWELVDRVGGVYNRLVLWDAKLIHSASSYEGLAAAELARARLVQLFFFSLS